MHNAQCTCTECTQIGTQRGPVVETPRPAADAQDIHSSIIDGATGKQILVRSEVRNVYSADDGRTWHDRDTTAVMSLTRTIEEVREADAGASLAALPPAARRRIVLESLRDMTLELGGIVDRLGPEGARSALRVLTEAMWLILGPRE